MPPRPDSQVIIGVDPGKSGGIAVLRTMQPCVSTFEMPESELVLYEVVQSFREHHDPELKITTVFIEQVNAMPGQGVTSMFNFGKEVGRLNQAFVLFPRRYVRPQVWQKALGIPPRKKTETQTQWKDRLRFKAQEMVPLALLPFNFWRLRTLAEQRAISDALLIALYGQQVMRGEHHAQKTD